MWKEGVVTDWKLLNVQCYYETLWSQVRSWQATIVCVIEGKLHTAQEDLFARLLLENISVMILFLPCPWTCSWVFHILLCLFQIFLRNLNHIGYLAKVKLVGSIPSFNYQLPCLSKRKTTKTFPRSNGSVLNSSIPRNVTPGHNCKAGFQLEFWSGALTN